MNESTDSSADVEPHAHHSQNAALVAELSELLSVVEPGSVANMVLQRAFSHRATDIHLDPTTLGTRIRFRVDGLLQDIMPIPADKAATLKSRIRVMAGMDISNRRLPQDGAISGKQFDLPRDIRVGSSPTVNGERLVLRLMPDPNEMDSLTSLGLFENQLGRLRDLLNAPYGLLLVVGPVGSGKSTTVYSLLKELNRPDKSLVTIEDPVERRIPGANQMQIDPRTGLTFAASLRAILRQDPDIISIGEIRDAETAQIACRAATTGVLVLSTLHANNAAAAVDVLRRFNIPSTAIGECLRGVISQRLVRMICPANREEYSPSQPERQLLHLDEHADVQIARGTSADANFGTGYTGRTAVFETMPVTDTIRNAINSDQQAHQIQQAAVHEGMATLEEATRRKVLDKVTTIDELQRIIVDAGIG